MTVIGVIAVFLTVITLCMLAVMFAANRYMRLALAAIGCATTLFILTIIVLYATKGAS